MIISFYVYDSAGRVVRAGMCQEEALEQQATGSDEIAVAGEAKPDVHRIVGGAPVELPPRPGPNFIFDYAIDEWIEIPMPDTSQTPAS